MVGRMNSVSWLIGALWLCVALPGVGFAQIDFSDPQVILAGTSRPSGNFVGDIDGDGDPDLVHVNNSMADAVINLYLNDGTGLFGDPTYIPVSAYGGHEVAGGDFDGDGDIDLAYTLYQPIAPLAESAQFILNNGDGTFSSPQGLVVSYNPLQIRAADLDEDGDVDLVMTVGNTAGLQSYLNDGSAHFTLMANVGGCYGASGFDLGDLNGDGDVDVVLASRNNNNVVVYFGDGAGGLTLQTSYGVGAYANGTAVIDLDEDGDMDFVTVAEQRHAALGFINDGTGSFTETTLIDLGVASGGPVAADFDFDGHLDLMIHVGGVQTIYQGDGTGSFTDPLPLNSGTNGGNSSIADVNGDGKLDIALSNDIWDPPSQGDPAVRIFLNQTPSLQQEIALNIPDGVTTGYAQPLDIPIQIGETTGAGVVSVELFISYDGALLIPQAPPVTTTAMTMEWTLEHNIEQGDGTSIDLLKIAMATDDAVLVGSGSLVTLHFDVVDQRSPAFSPLVLEHALLNDGTPSVVTTDGSVMIVGTDGQITSLPGEIIPRWSVGVSVIDADADLDGAPGTDQVSVDVANTGNSDTVTLILDETAATAGSFTGTVATEFGLAALADGLIQAQAGEAIVFTFADELDSEGNGPFDRTAQTDVIGGTDGALRVTVVTQPGDTVRVRVTDLDLNAAPLTQETTTVASVNSITGESETITLTELDIDNEVFFGTVKTTYGAVAGTDDDGVFNARKGDELVITYADTLLANGGTADLPDIDYVVDPFGDADANGQVQAFDAAKVLLHCLMPYLTGLDSLSANLDLLAFDPDPVIGRITPYDASLILQKRVGLIDRFEVQEDEADNHPQPETDNSVPKAVPEERRLMLQMHDGYLSVWADERDGILSGDLLLAGVEGSAVMSEELPGFLSASRETKDGMRVVFAGAEAVTGPGELLCIDPVGPEPARLTRATLNDGRLGVRLDDRIGGVDRQLLSYALHANVPNPFNPETVIRFDLPHESVVELVVFDVVGQRVRVLVAEQLPSGTHQALWDGRGDNGPVSSGVYFCRLQAQHEGGEFRQVRQMLLLK